MKPERVSRSGSHPPPAMPREISKQEVFTAIDGMVDYSFIERINKNTLLIRVEEKNFSS